MATKKKRYKSKDPKPDWVRANDYKRIRGGSYIVRRNEHGAATYVVGKATRKLSTPVEVEYALKQGQMVAVWAGKYFRYVRVTPDVGREILDLIWEQEERRGVERPEMSDYDKESFDI
ncbi:MAG: hypothetical protein MAG453_00603 [Calditrichaeota bacterium]|nr:hypothetical protein [Calditrichota bacterium]